MWHYQLPLSISWPLTLPLCRTPALTHTLLPARPLTQINSGTACLRLMEHTPENTYTPHSNSSICASTVSSAPRSVSHTHRQTHLPSLTVTYITGKRAFGGVSCCHQWFPAMRTKRMMVRGSFNLACAVFVFFVFFFSWCWKELQAQSYNKAR